MTTTSKAPHHDLSTTLKVAAVALATALALLLGPLVRVHLWVVTLVCSGLALGQALEAGHPAVSLGALVGAAFTAVGPVGPRWSSLTAWLVVVGICALDVGVILVMAPP